MYERIKELATQCIMNSYEMRVGIEDFERFAKLIITECCKEITQDPFNAVAASAWLKQHFGVE